MLAELIGSTGSLGFVKVHPATTLIQYKGSAYVFGGVHRNNAAQFQLAIVIKHVFKLSNAPDAE